jgi:hypothetical protein
VLRFGCYVATGRFFSRLARKSWKRKSFRSRYCKIYRRSFTECKNVRYEIDMKKIMSPGGTTVGLANGIVLADNKKIYSAESLKVGLFK